MNSELNISAIEKLPTIIFDILEDLSINFDKNDEEGIEYCKIYLFKEILTIIRDNL